MHVPQTFYSADQIERHSSGKTHFFDPGAKRFFRSRIGSNAYPTANPFVTYFVTSEQFEDSRGRREPRCYTVRSYDWRTADISTVGEFQRYATGRTAALAAKRMAGEVEYSVQDQHEYALLLNEDYDYEEKRGARFNDPYRLNQFKHNHDINPLPQPTQIESIRVDNSGRYADRWSIYGEDFIISSSDDPTHPYGVWSARQISNWTGWNQEVGLPSSWANLPITLQRHLINFFKEETVNA